MVQIFSVRGRLDRLPYFWIIVGTTVFILFVILSLNAVEYIFGDAAVVRVSDGIRIAACFVALIVVTCATIRRLHDFDQSGWWVPSLFVIDLLRGYFEVIGNRFANGLTVTLLIGILAVIAMTPGSRRSNRFGECA